MAAIATAPLTQNNIIMKTYYVYAQGILNLWALVFTTNDKNEAHDIARQYNKAKVLLNKMN